MLALLMAACRCTCTCSLLTALLFCNTALLATHGNCLPCACVSCNWLRLLVT
jgi:hypothetical protein